MSTLSVSKFAEHQHDEILVLLHGWGSSSKIWKSSVTKLSEFYTVWCIDLPGHGDNHTIAWDGSVKQGIELLADALPTECSIIGWSLGGLFAQLYMFHYPMRVKSLTLIASTPKFVASKNWPYGMPKERFSKFRNNYSKAPKKTLEQFLVLQSLHSNDAKKIRQELAQTVVTSNFQKIAWGLQWLEEIDLRKETIPEHISVCWLQGEMDQVVSLQCIEEILNIWPMTHLCKFSNAAHVPFLSHPELFIEYIRDGG